MVSDRFVFGVRKTGSETIRPDGSKDIDTFIVDPFGGSWARTIRRYDSNGTTLLSTVTNNWSLGYTNGSVPCFLVSCLQASAYYHATLGYSSVGPVSVFTTLPVPSGNITNQVAYGWLGGTPQSGILTSIQEWGFRSGDATTAQFPGVPDRGTYITYASLSTYITDRVATKTICNNVTSSPADPYCPSGMTTVARTVTTYDAYASNGSGQLVAPATVVQNHDDSSHGGSYTLRGNPTQISKWVSGTTYLTTALTYDTTGQVTASRDPNLNYTSYGYRDAFWDDDNQNPPGEFIPTTETNAYLAVIADNIGQTQVGYYYGTGKPAETLDYNSTETYFHYYDPFDRPTETDYPIGWAKNTYTSLTQFDTYAAIGDATASTACVSCSHMQALLDSQGRVTSQSLVNNPSAQSFESTTYDGMNRAATVSHPNFGASDPNNVSETPHYDGLGRSLGVTHPDNQATKIAYGAAVTALGGLSVQQSSSYGIGFPVLSVDEVGNLREEWHDGFGRVIEVDEPSGAGGLTSPLFTNYKYDALGNLTNVVQGSQSRTYQYDGLSRLTQEGTPEAGTVTLSYTMGGGLCSGSASNPCTRTDARGIVTTYLYDTANRLTKKTHSDTTGTVTYVYGTSAASYNIGRLLTMTDPSGSETYTYDQMGRVTQLAKTIGTTTYTAKYVYNAAGQLTQITYPSGRNVYNVYDNVGHLCLVSAVSATSCSSTSAYLTIPSSGYDAANRPLTAIYGNGLIANAAYSAKRSQLASLGVGNSLSTTITSITGLFTVVTATVSSNAGFNVGDTITIAGNSNPYFNASWTITSVSTRGNTVSFAVTTRQATGTGGTMTDNDVSGAATLLGLTYYYQQDSTNCPNGKTLNNSQIQCITDSSVGTGDSGRSVAYTYDYLGRLSTASTTGSTAFGKWGLSETYDRYGNRGAQTALPGTVGTVPQPSFSINTLNNQINTSGYTYDLSGHLTAEPAPFNTSYTYDGEDCLTNYHSGLNGNTATYTCDGNRLRVKKVVTGPNAITTVSIYSGGQVIAEYDNNAPVTSPTREYIYGHNLLATITGSTGGTGGTVTYVHRDHRSPRLYTNSAGANTGEQGTYPFGEPWYTSNATSNWVFTTYERDQESGIDYALARSYHSGEGRFMSPDPVKGNATDPQSWNRYAYSLNDPINNSDPSGQDPCPVSAFTGVPDCPGSSDSGSSDGSSDEASGTALGFGGFGVETPGGSFGATSPGDVQCLLGGDCPMGADFSHLNPSLVGNILGGLFGFPNLQSSGTACLCGPLAADPLIQSYKKYLFALKVTHGTLPLVAAIVDPIAGGEEDFVQEQALRFTQNTASPRFSAEGNFGGQTISDVASQLRTGTLSPSDVPVQVVGDGLIVNTRSALALTQAGIPQSEWTLIGGNAATEAQIAQRLADNGLTRAGTDVIRITGFGKNASTLVGSGP